MSSSCGSVQKWRLHTRLKLLLHVLAKFSSGDFISSVWPLPHFGGDKHGSSDFTTGGQRVHTSGLPGTAAGVALSEGEPWTEPARSEIPRRDLCTFPRATGWTSFWNSGKRPRCWLRTHVVLLCNCAHQTTVLRQGDDAWGEPSLLRRMDHYLPMRRWMWDRPRSPWGAGHS